MKVVGATRPEVGVRDRGSRRGAAAISRERGRVLCDRGSTEKPVSLAEGPLARSLYPFFLLREANRI